MISKQFRKKLDEKGLSVYKVSQETKIPVSTLYDWIHGRTSPSVEGVQKIAKFLDVTMEELID